MQGADEGYICRVQMQGKDEGYRYIATKSKTCVFVQNPEIAWFTRIENHN